MVYYCDTSALTKLVVEEAESAAFQRWLAGSNYVMVACDLARTELSRVVRRTAPDRMIRAHAVLRRITLTTVPTALFDQAGRLDRPVLRSLDAIHLAAALDWGDDLEGLVAYDDRLADAARAHGITVIAPR